MARESGLPPSVLAHQMIGGVASDLINERGVEAALELLRELLGEIEQAAPRRAN